VIVLPANYILLERIELNASAASITFANIPQSGYTDLKVVMSARNASGTENNSIAINGSTSGFTLRGLGSDGSTTYSYSRSDNLNVFLSDGSGNTANTFSSSEIYFPNYLGSNNKSYSIDTVVENNATGASMGLQAGLWSNSAAINSITFNASNGSGSFVQYSTFSLYGLAALGTEPVIAPKASGGDVIDFDGTYWIHTFLTSGTFTPQTGLTCDYLVVAGGGGGGYAGGGAGGFRTGTSLSVAATAQTITVGAGGAGGANGTIVPGTNGTDSIFSSITSSGGGGGGGANSAPDWNGKNGGSGGGAGYSSTGSVGSAGSGNTPSTSPSQGNSGGAAVGNDRGMGGGGGAGAVGSNGTTSVQGAGGAGTANSYSGSSVTYAGGGGAGGTNVVTTPGAGGAGGGGAGGTITPYSNGVNGTVNRGGGGGGGNAGGAPNTGGSGGSGIVIIRYLA